MRTPGFVPVLALVFLLAGPAGARSLRAVREGVLKQQYAQLHNTTAAKVLQLQAHDLAGAPGVAGFTLGRHRSRDGKWTRAGAVVYYRCGERLCLVAVRLSNADKVRSTQLLDLFATTELRLRGSWLADAPVAEPAHSARWPVLVVETEYTLDQHRRQEVSLISLRKPKRPESLLRFTTLSTRVGSTPGRRPGRRPKRFNGTRVTSARLVKEPGKPPRLTVMEKRLSTRFDRCAAPTPVPTLYELEGERFVVKSRPRAFGGCR